MIRIQRTRKKGSRLPPNCVCITRPSMLGNPFKVGVHGTVDECVTLFRQLLTCDDIAMVGMNVKYGFDHNRINLLRDTWRDRLSHADCIACYCPLDKPCHGDVYIELLKELYNG